MIINNSSYEAAAQDSDPETSWIFAGASAKASEKTRLYAYYGYNHKQDLNAIYTQAMIRLNKYISLSPAYIHVVAPKVNGLSRNEHALLSSVIFSIPTKHIIIDDRNMLWSRFRKNFEDQNFYRNRLRVMHPFKVAKKDGRLFVYDEGFYSFNNNRWSRNRLAIGAGIAPTKWLNTEFSYARQNDHYTGNLNIFFIFFTVQLEHWGVFKKKNSETK